MKVLLFRKTLYPTNNMRLIILLLLSLLVSKVTTFELFNLIKDAIEYEHCGSVWIEPDIYGNYDIYKHEGRPLIGGQSAVYRCNNRHQFL